MKWFSLVGLAVLPFIFFTGLILAGEVPAPADAPASAQDKVSYWNLIIALETVWKLIGTAGTILIAWVFKLIGSKLSQEESTKKVMTVLQEGVSATYVEFVQELKRAASDGKLKSDEIKIAREMAYNKAKDMATGPTKAILMAWGKEKAYAVIELIINKLKKKKE